jgi:Flp pilus assembly protein CpaB
MAAFLLVRAEQTRVAALGPALGTPVPVVVAAEPLHRGTELAPEDLRVELVPARYAPPGALRQPEEAAGRTLVSDLAPGEAVTATRLAAGGGPVAAQVPSGLRAFVVPSGMPAGVVSPGDRVDVLATFGGQHPYTRTVASGLEVLSVLAPEGGLAGPAPEGPSLVLLVSPATAEALAHATAFGHLTVTIAGAPD